MKKLNKTALKWTILAIALLQMGGMGLSPSLAAISADMPEVPVSIVQTITSFPSFVMIFVCIAAIKLSEKFGKKRVLLFGEVSILAAGILGYLLHSSIVELYIWAALLGIGFGTILPTCSGILAENYDERERGGIMGIQSVFTNIGAMYLTYVGGALAVIKWNLNYLVYLIALLPLVMGILFIPADRGVSGAQSAAGETKKVRVGDLSRATWVYGAFTFLFMICYGVHSANIAFFVTEKNLGTAATVGTIMALCTIGGMAGGATFKYVNKVFDTYTLGHAHEGGEEDDHEDVVAGGPGHHHLGNALVRAVVAVHQLDHPADHALAHEQQRGRGHHHGLLRRPHRRPDRHLLLLPRDDLHHRPVLLVHALPLCVHRRRVRRPRRCRGNHHQGDALQGQGQSQLSKTPKNTALPSGSA